MINAKKLTASLLTATVIVGSISTCAADGEEIPQEDIVLSDRATGSDVKNVYELQLEYLSGSAFSSRKVNNYNVHFYRKMHEHRALSFYEGLTFTRAVGYTAPVRYGGEHFDSDGVGIGPGGLLRWESKVSGKLYASWDFAGSFMFYNKAHPAMGRAYGFLWRTGPRVTWRYGGDDSISLGYSVSHFSNAMKNHNPGYNTLGFSLGISHKF